MRDIGSRDIIGIDRILGNCIVTTFFEECSISLHLMMGRGGKVELSEFRDLGTRVYL